MQILLRNRRKQQFASILWWSAPGRWPLLLLALIGLAISCQPDDTVDPQGIDLTIYEYNPTSYDLQVPAHFNSPNIPADNPLTEEGIALGRYLFYDPILSVDSTISCASCHHLELAFSDDKALSEGVDGTLGFRNAMSLANVAYYENGLFWDGRVQTLEEQSLHPIQDPLEMKETLPDVEKKLQDNPFYQQHFRAAFGIETNLEIDRDLIGKALAQFQRILISGESKYDFANFDWGEEQQFFTSAELRGRNMFFSEPDNQDDPHAGCTHCHTSLLLTTDEYFNNGLDEVNDLNDFTDLGRGGVTNYLIDNGRFRTPTLRNIALTAPYMHDGRFGTLEEVIEHYSSGGHYAPNVDANIIPFPLTEEQKSDLVAFLETMTDYSFIGNPEFSNPFE